MESIIDINNASTKELSQLPGIAKNVANRIVNHRDRHGYFTRWEELARVKDFPVHALEKIQQRAILKVPADAEEADAPHRITGGPIQQTIKKPMGRLSSGG